MEDDVVIDFMLVDYNRMYKFVLIEEVPGSCSRIRPVDFRGMIAISFTISAKHCRLNAENRRFAYRLARADVSPSGL